MTKVKIQCAWCKMEIFKYPSQIGKNSYCSKECRNKHLSREHNPNGYAKHPHLSKLNEKLNPGRMTAETKEKIRNTQLGSREGKSYEKLNPRKMTAETKEKIRNARLGSGEGKSYEKTYGRHTHRIVAEQKLGRKLSPGEVVHHIDGVIRNNDPNNLMVFPSQKEHANWHAKYGEVVYGYRHGLGKGGDASCD